MKLWTYPPIDVVLGAMFIIDNRFVVAQNVETKSWRWTVCVVQYASEYICIAAEVVASVP